VVTRTHWLRWAESNSTRQNLLSAGHPTDGYDRPAIGLLYELPEQGGPGAG